MAANCSPRAQEPSWRQATNPLHHAPPGACMPDTLESRRTKRGAPGYGGRNEGECGVPPPDHHTSTTPDYQYTEPEPTRWPRPPKGEGEAM